MLLLRREYKKEFFLSVFLLVTLVFSLFPTRDVKAQNASLYFSPSAGRVEVGQDFSVVVRMNTGGTAVNAAEGAVVYDNQKVTVTSISKSGSVFTIWASEPQFSNAEGSINFGGGIPNPGYSGSNGLVLTINFKAKSATTVRGQTEIVFVSGAVLANDGEGTNILASLGRANYFIGASAEPSSTLAPITPGSVATAPVMSIRSVTHPDQSKWYADKNPVFTWDVPSGVMGVRLLLSKKAETAPIVDYVPAISEKTLTDLEDGVWYLNGRFRTAAGFGPTTSFKFQIDIQKPEEFTVTRLDTADPTNPKPELLFKSSDALSGIAKYQMKIGEGDWFDIDPSLVGEAYVLPLQVYGTREVLVKAVDGAGNFSEAEITILTEPIPKPLLKEVTVESQKIIIKGSARPFYKVLIHVVSEMNSEPIVYETVADAKGSFKLNIADLSAGQYSIYAQSKDNRGAVSEPSNTMTARISKGFLTFIYRIFDLILNFLSQHALFMAFLLALVGLLLALVKLFGRKIEQAIDKFVSWWVLHRTKTKAVKKVHHIFKDMEEELEFLKKISGRRELNSAEKFIKIKLEQYLKALKFLRKEDVEE